MQKKLLCLFVLLAVLFVGCGSTVHADMGLAQILPDRLEVVSVSHPADFHRTITDQASVEALYEALYALPKIQPPSLRPHQGPGPVSFGYRLQFFAQQRLLKQVVLQTISFHGLELAPHDYRQVTDNFWSLFAQTVHEPKEKLFSPAP